MAVFMGGVYCSQLLKRQKGQDKYVNKCELKISTKPSIILDVLQHRVVLGNSRFVGELYDKVDCCQSCAVIYVSLSDGAGASVVIVLASRVAGGVASAW